MDSLRRFFDRFVHRVQSREDTTSSGVQPVREADAALAQKQLANRLFEEGRAARERGDPEAVPLLRRCLEIQERLLAEDDPFLAPTRNELGLALKEAGSLGEASDLFLRAHTYFARCQGEKHADYANTLHNYAATLLQRGEYEEGLAHMRRALDVRERLGNASPLDLSNTYWILGSAVLGQESIALLERALHERARAGETTGPALAAIWRELANALVDER